MEDKPLTAEEYQTVSCAWDSLDNKSLGQFMRLTLITDCLFMSDIICRFRKAAMKDLKVDPIRYYTMASFAWDSALRFSETVLELPTSVDVHLMIENAIRGGLAVVGNPRYSKANNPELRDFEPEKEVSYIDFLDFNGLYTAVMKSARLPMYGFRFLTDWEIKNFDLMSIEEDSDHGYILEVDLTYPVELHDYHDDFPLAPEHLTVGAEDLSEYTKETAKSCGLNLEGLSNSRRLCLTLKDKKRYTTHYRNLQFYVRQGLIVTRVHRILTFVQCSFLQSFMEYCSDKRKTANSCFYKSMWKNISNLVSGKSYENPRNYMDVRICTSEQQLAKLVAKPSFQGLRVLDDNTTAVQMYRKSVVLNRPITVGFTILELSKLEVYSFYYDFVKPVLARAGRVSFLAGDTDSFVLKISGLPDLRERYARNEHLFDFSNLPDGHPMKSNKNKMVPGKLKFELPGHACEEFVALSPKCYSMKTDKGFKQARKGCSRDLKHELYKKCLLTNSYHVEYLKEIRHFDQQPYQVSVSKKVLSVLDVKRHHFNSIESVSFGHYSLQMDDDM